MFKIIAALGLAVFLVACEPRPSSLTGISADRGSPPTECLDGVEYYLFDRGAGQSRRGYIAVKYNADSTVSTC